VRNEPPRNRVDIPVPAYRPTLDRFSAECAGSGPEKLVEFFEPSAREEMLTRLTGVFAKKGWERPPPILDTEISPQDEMHVGAVHELEGGKLTVRWSYHIDGSWRISTLKVH